jgi:uncharacterized protein YciI
MPEMQICYVVEATYVDGAQDKRQPYRDQHLERLEKLLEEGALILVGAFEDMSASLLVLAVESAEAAEAIVKTDIYHKQGIWTEYTIRRLNKVEFNG